MLTNIPIYFFYSYLTIAGALTAHCVFTYPFVNAKANIFNTLRQSQNDLPALSVRAMIIEVGINTTRAKDAKGIALFGK